MTDLHTPSLPVTTPASTAPRSPYQTPRVQPLGEWAALTLVTSLPIGPGGMVFGGSTRA